MTNPPLIWQLALLGRNSVAGIKDLMLPKFFFTTSPKAEWLGLGEGGCHGGSWEFDSVMKSCNCWSADCYCRWQRCKLILKRTEGTWRGPTVPREGRGQRQKQQWSRVKTAPRVPPGSWMPARKTWQPGFRVHLEQAEPWRRWLRRRVRGGGCLGFSIAFVNDLLHLLYRQDEKLVGWDFTSILKITCSFAKWNNFSWSSLLPAFVRYYSA